MKDAQECGQEAPNQFQDGMSKHAAAGSDWQAQSAQGQAEFTKGAGTFADCMGKGAADGQKAFSGRRRRSTDPLSISMDIVGQINQRNKRSIGAEE